MLWLLAAAIFVARLAISIVLGWNTTDEAWNLQVVQRCLSGETLYRDVYYGVTPLPMYISCLFCAIFGVQAIVLKALSAATFAGIFLATCDVLRRAGATMKPWSIAVLIALVPIAPYTAALYNDLSPLSILLLASAVLAWQAAPDIRRAAWVGILLGLCFAAKQNTGSYAALCVAAVVMFSPVAPIAQRLRHLAAAAVASMIVTALFLLPIVLMGGWHDMMIQCFSNKSSYLQHAAVSFFDGFRTLAESAASLPQRPAAITFFWSLIFPLAILAPAAYAVALVRKPTRGMITLLPFLLALAGNMYPRADIGHVARAFPAMLIALILAAPAFPKLLARSIAADGMSLAGIALILLLLAVPWRMASRRYVFSTLPHTRGIMLRVEERDRLKFLASTIAAQPRPLFILSTEAGALYLISDTKNPTRYDYPLVNAFPPGEQQRTIEAIHSHRIRTVIFQNYFPPSLLPGDLANFITSRRALAQSLGGYDIYSNEPATTAPR
jgi:hypothetical protein